MRAPPAPRCAVRGFEVSVPTVHSDPAEPLHVSVDIVPVEGDPRDHGFGLTLAELSTISRWLLDAASARETAGSDEPIALTIPDEETPGLYRLAPRRARELGEAMAEALDVLDAHPPRADLHVIGALEGATTDGAAHRVEVYVELLVRDAEDIRIKLEVPTGTWTFIDAEVIALAKALDDAAAATSAATFLALEPSAEETLREPWLTVARRPDALASLRLYDDLVQETGADGVLLFAADRARELASLLRAAIAFRDATPPSLLVPPEPFERVVARSEW